MICLLDVNALLALAFAKHVFHRRVETWILGSLASGFEALTCSIVELGFVRVAAASPAFGQNVTQALEALARLKGKSAFPFRFLTDGQGADRLPDWVKTPRQTTDGHLVALAAAHGAVLATLDEGIPGAFLIPPTPNVSAAS